MDEDDEALLVYQIKPHIEVNKIVRCADWLYFWGDLFTLQHSIQTIYTEMKVDD
jgi:hypothetical protein